MNVASSGETVERAPLRQAIQKFEGVIQVSLEITQACNYRCVMCDYWRIPNPKYMPVSMADDFFRVFSEHQLKSVLITGGEPLLHPNWRTIAEAAPKSANLNLCTNGSPVMVRHLDAMALFNRITLSIDGATAETFMRIRGRDHLGRLLSMMERLKAALPNITIYWKMTIQRRNFREIGQVFDLARNCGFVDGIAYGIPDFSAVAFGFNETGFEPNAYFKTMMPDIDELAEMERIVDEVHDKYAQEIADGFLYEGDLRRYLQRFKAMHGLAQLPPERLCSIPYHSIVLKANGDIASCYFLERIGTSEDLQREGEAFHSRMVKAHNSQCHNTCRRCDQLLFRNSPFEHDPRNIPYSETYRACGGK